MSRPAPEIRLSTEEKEILLRWMRSSKAEQLQSLNAGFFVYAEHQRVLWRIQVKAYHIGSLATELRIGAHAPALPTLKMQVVLSHHPPDLVLAHIAQMLGQQPPIPAAVAWRRRLIERFQDPLFGKRSVLAALFPRANAITKAGHSVLSKSP